MSWGKVLFAVCVVVCLSIAGVIVALAWMAPTGDIPRLLRFLGHLHPMVLHLPIGMLFAVALLELYFLARPRHRSSHAVISLLTVTALGAAVTACAGQVLAWQGGYDDTLLFRHQWLGAATAGVALFLPLLALLVHWRAIHGGLYAAAFAGALLLLTLAGHFGGSLTHGADYLTRYWPLGPTPEKTPVAAIPSETRSFHAEYVQPIFDEYCVQCHGPTKQKDDLRLDAVDFLLASGKLDEIVPHMRRPLEAEGHMPPKGKPQPEAEQIDRIAQWIEAGADPNWVPQTSDEESLVVAETADGEPDGSGTSEIRPWEAIADAVSVVNGLGKLEVLPISADNPELRVRAVARDATLTPDDVAALGPLASQVAWLDLSGTCADDAALAVVAKMPRLTRLYLQNTAITDTGVHHLTELPRLRYLNLHGTGITDTALEHLAKIPSLRKVYLWGTQTTPEAATQLHAALYDQSTERRLREQAAALEQRIANLAVTIDQGVPLPSADEEETDSSASAQSESGDG